MLEVVFNENAGGSLKIAKQQDKTNDLFGHAENVFCLPLKLSIGNIANENFWQHRQQVINQLYQCFNNSFKTEEYLNTIKTQLSSLLNKIKNGENVRIWYRENADEYCALYYFLATILPYFNFENHLYIISIPNWIITKNEKTQLIQGWNDISTSQWKNYLQFQREIPISFCKYCLMKWNELKKENAPLRILLNGNITSVNEDFYDTFILHELTKEPIEETLFIAHILEKYHFMISDLWMDYRIEKMIHEQKIIVVSQTSAFRYQRIIQKK